MYDEILTKFLRELHKHFYFLMQVKVKGSLSVQMYHFIPGERTIKRIVCVH